MDNFTVMAIVNCIQKLNHNGESVLFTELALRMGFPKFSQLPSFQILHNNKKLLLLWQWEIVIELDDVFMAKLAQRLNLLRNHVGLLKVFGKVEDLNSHLLLYNSIVCQEH